jgi:hypothetical protein
MTLTAQELARLDAIAAAGQAPPPPPPLHELGTAPATLDALIRYRRDRLTRR